MTMRSQKRPNQSIQFFQFPSHQSLDQFKLLLNQLLNLKLSSKDQLTTQLEYQCKLPNHKCKLTWIFHNFKDKLNAGVNS